LKLANAFGVNELGTGVKGFQRGVGVNERNGETLYNTQLLFDAD